MKTWKNRFLALLLCLAMLIATLSVTVLAEGAGSADGFHPSPDMEDLGDRIGPDQVGDWKRQEVPVCDPEVAANCPHEMKYGIYTGRIFDPTCTTPGGIVIDWYCKACNAFMGESHLTQSGDAWKARHHLEAIRDSKGMRNCKLGYRCTVCGQTFTNGTYSHKMAYVYEDDKHHTGYCTNEGCDFRIEHELHDWGDAVTAVDDCELCGFHVERGVKTTATPAPTQTVMPTVRPTATPEPIVTPEPHFSHTMVYVYVDETHHRGYCSYDGCDFVIEEELHDFGDAVTATDKCVKCGVVVKPHGVQITPTPAPTKAPTPVPTPVPTPTPTLVPIAPDATPEPMEQPSVDAQPDDAEVEPDADTAPEQQPEVVAPEEDEPEDSEPEVSEPEVSEPEVTEPEANEPEVSEPEVSEPEVTEPEVNGPEVAEPEVTEPEVTEPEVNEPEVAEPEVTEPEVTEPEVTEPEVNEPEVAEPEVAEPEVAEPEISDPEATEPEVTAPEVSEPEVTEPEVSEPEVAEPEVSKPEVAEPEVAEPEQEPEVVQPEVEPAQPEQPAPKASAAPAPTELPAAEPAPAVEAPAAVPTAWKEVAEKLTFAEVKSVEVAAGAPVSEVVVRQAEIEDGSEAFMALTVEWKADGAAIPGGKLRMSVPMELEAGTFKLVRVEEDGTLTEIEFTYEDGMLSFDAEDISLYLLMPVE